MNNKNLIENNGGVTAETLQMWKNQNRRVAEIEVVDDNEKHIGYFKRPTMETFSAVSVLGKKDEVKAANTLFENCWLGGSPIMQTDAVVKMAAIGQLNVLMGGCVATIKNL